MAPGGLAEGSWRICVVDLPLGPRQSRSKAGLC